MVWEGESAAAHGASDCLARDGHGPTPLKWTTTDEYSRRARHLQPEEYNQTSEDEWLGLHLGLMSASSWLTELQEE